MPLTSAQIITLACQTAKCPNFTSQAGQLLNAILSDLCQDHDLDKARCTFNFNFNPSLVVNTNFVNVQSGSGPYALPADYLRARKGDVMWFNQGVPYPLIPIDIDEFDVMVQTAGFQAFPYLFATDMAETPPVAVVWPGANGAYPVMVRYYSQMPDIGSGTTSENGWASGSASPETSSVVPWFPNQRFLLKKLSGMLMEITGDDRAETFLGEGTPQAPGADAILRKYLTMKDDNDNRAKRVELDRRRFGRNFNTLPNTKQVGF